MPSRRRTPAFCPAGRGERGQNRITSPRGAVLDQPPCGKGWRPRHRPPPASAVPCGILVPCLPVVCGWMPIPHRCAQWLDGIPCGFAGTVLTGGNVSGGCLSGVLSPFVGNGECGENGERPFRNGMWERGCSGMVGFPRIGLAPYDDTFRRDMLEPRYRRLFQWLTQNAPSANVSMKG